MKYFVIVLLTAKACLSVVECLSEPDLQIYPNQTYIIAPVTRSLTLICEVKDEKYNNMEWSHVGRGRITNDVIKIGSMLKLTFSNPNIRDSGKYSCKASILYSIFDRSIAAEVSIKFYEPIAFHGCQENQILIFGQTGSIYCGVVGNPMPSISWKKDGDLINSERITIKESSLTISSVSEEDMGTYIIEAFEKETGKSLRQIIHVNVITPPVIIDFPEEFTLIPGGNNTIKCGATGSEPLTYTWYDYLHQDVSQGLLSHAHKVDHGVLTISKVALYLGDYYTCEVSNLAGSDKATVKIKIQRPEICDVTCEYYGNIGKILLGTDLKELCSKGIEHMKCWMQKFELCPESEISYDILMDFYDYFAAYQEIICSENTLFQAVLADNLKCLQRVANMETKSRCNAFEGCKMESIARNLIEDLNQKRLVSLDNYRNDSQEFRSCIKFMIVFACHALIIEDECGAVTMYVYQEIMQKVKAKLFGGVYKELFHLIPEVFRHIKKEEENENALIEFSSLNKLL